MSLAATIASLPGDTRVSLVVGSGDMTLDELATALTDRDTEERPTLDDQREATYRMWEDIATRNLCRDPWEPGVSVSDIRAFHASRYSSDPMPRRSS
jgi:hypothetical protein